MAEAGGELDNGSDEVHFNYKTQAGPSRERAEEKAEDSDETNISEDEPGNQLIWPKYWFSKTTQE